MVKTFSPVTSTVKYECQDFVFYTSLIIVFSIVWYDKKVSLENILFDKYRGI